MENENENKKEYEIEIYQMLADSDGRDRKEILDYKVFLTSSQFNEIVKVIIDISQN